TTGQPDGSSDPCNVRTLRLGSTDPHDTTGCFRRREILLPGRAEAHRQEPTARRVPTPACRMPPANRKVRLHYESKWLLCCMFLSCKPSRVEGASASLRRRRAEEVRACLRLRLWVTCPRSRYSATAVSGSCGRRNSCRPSAIPSSTSRPPSSSTASPALPSPSASCSWQLPLRRC